MGRLTRFPTQADLSLFKQFYSSTGTCDTSPQVTKLLVDDCVIPVTSAVLSLWSVKFHKLRDENNEVYLEGFVGNCEQVKNCLDLLHGHDVDISFNNIQVVLKFGLLFDIEDLTKLAEEWIEDKLDTNKYTDISDYDDDSMSMHVDNFIVILRIGLKIAEFYDEYDFIFEVCSKEYESYPNKILDLMRDEFTTISKPLLKFLFRKQKSMKYSLDLLKVLPKTQDDIRIIVEVLDESLFKNKTIRFTLSSGIISLLDMLSQSDIPMETLKKITSLSLKLHQQSCDIHDIIREKPWRDLKMVKDLFEFRERHASISEYMYIEIMIDWVRYDQNYLRLNSGEKGFLLNSIQKVKLNMLYLEDRANLLDRYSLPTENILRNNVYWDYPVTEYHEWSFENPHAALNKIHDLDFSGIWLDVHAGSLWCKEASVDAECCKRICISLVPNTAGNKDTKMKVIVDRIKNAHSANQCPLPTFVRWNINFTTGEGTCKYVSSEIFTYQEVEDFVKQYPECEVFISVIYKV